MAVNHPALTDSALGLRRYREATSYLVRKERTGRAAGGASCRGCPPRPPLASPSPPRSRPTTTTLTLTVSGSPETEPRSPSPSPSPSPTPSRCRARPPSPPPPASPGSKAPRSVSPGGTPAASAGAALRRGDREERDQDRGRRRVCWAEALVSSVHVRPRTPRRDVAALFYSRADERRFRKEAEAARDEDSLSSLTSLASLSGDEMEDRPQGLWTPTRERKDYGISKAVVVFGDSTRTYGGGCAAEARQAGAGPAAAFAFDDAAFWNGQLTWS